MTSRVRTFSRLLPQHVPARPPCLSGLCAAKPGRSKKFHLVRGT